MVADLLFGMIRCPVRPCAVRTGRPGNPGLARRIKPEQRRCRYPVEMGNHSSSVPPIATSPHTMIVDLVSRIASRDGDCAVQFKRLR